MLHDPVKTSL